MDESEIFITGANGQLGTALKNKYKNAKSADIKELDITETESVNNYNWGGIKYIFNAAAFTDVDGAESPEGRSSAWNVNAVAVANLVKIAQQKDITMVHVSTDYVFDGSKSPHKETELLSPLGVYGQSKAAGDIIVSLLPKHYILRASWVIGEGKNFVRTMLGLGQKGISPSVVADQIGRLTFADTLVGAIDHLIKNQSTYGIYNVTNDGEPASWADITRKIFELAGLNIQVTDTTTAEYFAGKPNSAPRPLQSTLSLAKVKAAGFSPNDWEEDLKRYIKKELQQPPHLDAAQGGSEE